MTDDMLFALVSTLLGTFADVKGAVPFGMSRLAGPEDGGFRHIGEMTELGLNVSYMASVIEAMWSGVLDI